MMEIKYIPTAEFVGFVKSKGDKAQWISVEGHSRWLITEDDGLQYIVRPDEALSSK